MKKFKATIDGNTVMVLKISDEREAGFNRVVFVNSDGFMDSALACDLANCGVWE